MDTVTNSLRLSVREGKEYFICFCVHISEWCLNRFRTLITICPPDKRVVLRYEISRRYGAPLCSVREYNDGRGEFLLRIIEKPFEGES